jgi:hypothetical protein
MPALLRGAIDECGKSFPNREAQDTILESKIHMRIEKRLNKISMIESEVVKRIVTTQLVYIQAHN